MGFFGSILSLVGRTIGRGIEKIGDVIGSSTLSILGMEIQDACEKVGCEKSYNKSEANIYTTERLNDILVSLSEKYCKDASLLEEKCIKYVEDYYDDLIHTIESMPNKAHNSANLKALKAGKREITKTIKRGITDPLSKRLSLDDSECLKILKMDTGDEKEKAMSDFTRTVIKEALANLSDKVRISLSDQSDDILDYLSGISEENEKTMQALKNQYDKMLKNNEQEQTNKEHDCVFPLYVIDVADYVNKILK